MRRTLLWQKSHDIVNGGLFRQYAGVQAGHFGPVVHQQLGVEFAVAPAQYMRAVQGRGARFFAFHHAVLLQDIVLCFAEHDLSRVDERDIVRHFFQVAGDVAGEQDAVLLILNEF